MARTEKEQKLIDELLVKSNTFLRDTEGTKALDKAFDRIGELGEVAGKLKDEIMNNKNKKEKEDAAALLAVLGNITMLAAQADSASISDYINSIRAECKSFNDLVTPQPAQTAVVVANPPKAASEHKSLMSAVKKEEQKTDITIEKTTYKGAGPEGGDVTVYAFNGISADDLKKKIEEIVKDPKSKFKGYTVEDGEKGTFTIKKDGKDVVADDLIKEIHKRLKNEGLCKSEITEKTEKKGTPLPKEINDIVNKSKPAAESAAPTSEATTEAPKPTPK